MESNPGAKPEYPAMTCILRLPIDGEGASDIAAGIHSCQSIEDKPARNSAGPLPGIARGFDV
jgi:hypothetical protein